MTYADRATRYARRVNAGKIVACEYVHLACKRHTDDIEKQRKKDYPYRYDKDVADDICRFVECLPHVKGKWMGSEIRLEDWQCFVYCVAFGWLRKSDDLRRFRSVYLEVPRKNAKSTMSAGAALFMFCADGEPGAEVYSGATTERQAWEVFGPARLMAKQEDDLQSQFGVTIGAKNMARLDMNAKFEPIIGNPGDGASPHMVVIDEYHEAVTSVQYDTMETGMGAREQPMMWTITTAGADTAGPCYELRSQLIDVLKGVVENDRFFGAIWTIDDGVDWASREALVMANPNLGVSVFEDSLVNSQRDAINNPYKQSAFKTKHLDVWVGAAAPYLNLEKWLKLDDIEPIEGFKGETCYGGLDLSAKIDTTSYVKLFRREIDGIQHYYVYGRTYVPEDRTKDADCRHYAAWVGGDYIQIAGSARVDYNYIESEVMGDSDTFGLMMGVDPWNATQVITNLQAHMGEDRVVEVPQTVNHISEPLKELSALIESGCIHHDGNPAHSWMVGNVTAKEDFKGNVYPRKEKPEKKIDFVSALLCALALALRHEPPPISRYETEGTSLGAI